MANNQSIRLEEIDIAGESFKEVFFGILGTHKYNWYRYHKVLNAHERPLAVGKPLLDGLSEYDKAFCVLENEYMWGLSICSYLEWDSEHFDHPVYRIYFFYSPSISASVLRVLVEDTLVSIRKKLHGIKSHVSCNIDIDEYVLLNILLESDFQLVDCRRAYVKKNVESFVDKRASGGMFCRPFRAGDRDELFRIFEEVDFESRFTRDSFFLKSSVKEMYRRWVSKLLDSPGADRPVLVVEKGNKVVAFGGGLDLNLEFYGIPKKICGNSLFFSSENGKGSYYSLVSYLAVNTARYYDALETVVSVNNNEAIRVLERCGFLAGAAQYSLHYNIPAKEFSSS